MTSVEFTIVLDPTQPGATSTFTVVVHSEWAPLGAKRFLDLIDAKYYDDARIYRVIPGFIAQWGVPADPKEWPKWGDNKIKDDPVKTSNTAGTMSFATSGPDCRGSQVFINYEDSCSQLDDQGFAPFGKLRRVASKSRKSSARRRAGPTKPRRSSRATRTSPRRTRSSRTSSLRNACSA